MQNGVPEHPLDPQAVASAESQMLEPRDERRMTQLLEALCDATRVKIVQALSSDNTLAVLAGSEVKDLEPLLDDIRKATGVTLAMKYSGTLEGAEAISGGAATDVAWFASGHYLSLLPAAGSRIVAQQKIMLSPVVIGVKKSVADKFGWTNNPNVTWKDIEAKSADGSFHFAMTNPAASNSGLQFVAVRGVPLSNGSGTEISSASRPDPRLRP